MSGYLVRDLREQVGVYWFPGSGHLGRQYGVRRVLDESVVFISVGAFGSVVKMDRSIWSARSPMLLLGRRILGRTVHILRTTEPEGAKVAAVAVGSKEVHSTAKPVTTDRPDGTPGMVFSHCLRPKML